MPSARSKPSEPTTGTVPVQRAWDQVGIGLSGLCAVHCLLLPAALALLPVWPAQGVLQAWLHPVLAAVVLPMALLALRAGIRRRHAPATLVLLGLGLLLVLAALAAHEVWGGRGEILLNLAGSSLLIAGHWRNQREPCRHAHPTTTTNTLWKRSHSLSWTPPPHGARPSSSGWSSPSPEPSTSSPSTWATGSATMKSSPPTAR